MMTTGPAIFPNGNVCFTLLANSMFNLAQNVPLTNGCLANARQLSEYVINDKVIRWRYIDVISRNSEPNDGKRDSFEAEPIPTAYSKMQSIGATRLQMMLPKLLIKFWQSERFVYDV